MSTVLLVAFLALAAVVAGCGGGGGSSSTTVSVPVAIGGGGTLSPDKVVLKGVAISDNTVELQVLFGGPSSTNKLASFSFDLLFSNSAFLQIANHTDTTTADVLQGTEELLVGPFNGNRISVGYVRLDHGENGFSGTTGTIVKIQLRTLSKGTTTVHFDGGVAFDASGAPNGVTYDGSSVTITQN